jgi:farnesyl diphosphate synthase
MTSEASPSASTFETRLRDSAAETQAALVAMLGDVALTDETARPPQLLAAMRHGTLNGGKRLRPFLVRETAAMLGGKAEAALRVGVALECLHCYSLIHDDLPAMDDDDLRRGQPTVHKAFDEATAILAGDALLTYAFDIITAPETDLSDRQKVELVLALSRAAGMGGMVGGQVLDIEAEKSRPDETGIVKLQAMKTGALLRFACEAGAIAAGASETDRQTMRKFGETVGLSFQLGGKTSGYADGRGRKPALAVWRKGCHIARRGALHSRPQELKVRETASAPTFPGRTACRTC